ncbi:MoxR family ATPase [Actinokineospora sp. NBRC 105648]|uniref:AAA family ATPase n=1 Tax=Actinokineospora sp. NBRC 105648 TaxID=3032206 RepID=UPI0024A43682|nr:MoxR family ATPase [Actinokineospora sp. NBRC 105648]GLZ40610.1 ATPase [Actinokineospora sp. NBRC 105648]
MTPAPTTATVEDVTAVRSVADAVIANVETVLRGKTGAVRLALACMLAKGHLLIEDVPGTGKTSLAKALAASVGGTSHRVQFTPDLLPGDITGVSVWDQGRAVFEFRPGPVFANVVVADEINRASPKTQSALLEVMEEAQVTVDGVGHAVPLPFLVVATQNPIDLEGTYRLPEAQLDRFLMRIALGHPDLDAEQAILSGRAAAAPPAVRPVVDPDRFAALQEVVSRVYVAPELARYIALLARATREHSALRLGVSTRGSLAVVRAAQAHAACAGRHFVLPDDVKAVATPVICHRLVLAAQADIRGATAGAVLGEVLSSVALPSSAMAGTA